MRKVIVLILSVATLLGGYWFFKSYQNPAQFIEETPTKKIKVVATFSILADMIQNIGRDYVDVQTIVGRNEDPHIYTPTPKIARLVANADIIMINGLGFEGWMTRLIQASGFKGKVIVVTEGIDPKEFSEKGHILFDPHAWNNVPNAKIYVKNITKALQEFDPEHHDAYQKQGDYYQQQLDVLDLWIRTEIKSVPQNRRKVITAHDAFQYYGLEYGITFLAPIGISTEEEPSAKGTAMLIDQIRAENIRAVFVENVSNTKLIEQIAKEANTDVDGVLYSDALSEKAGPAPTYIAYMRHNTSTLIHGMKS